MYRQVLASLRSAALRPFSRLSAGAGGPSQPSSAVAGCAVNPCMHPRVHQDATSSTVDPHAALPVGSLGLPQGLVAAQANSLPRPLSHFFWAGGAPRQGLRAGRTTPS